MMHGQTQIKYFKRNQQHTKLHNSIYYYNALHVSEGSFAHHQELKTVYTVSGICQAFTVSYSLLMQVVRSRKSSTNTRCCVHSFELLMIGGGTV